MNTAETIRENMKSAMRAKERLKVTVLRSLLAAFTNELVAQKRMPTDTLEEDAVIKVIKRAAKQRKDSIEQFTKGDRPELAQSETDELVIIEEYLPAEATVAEIEKTVDEQIVALDCAGDMSKMGMLMGAVIKSLGGNADGNIVKDVVMRKLK